MSAGTTFFLYLRVYFRCNLLFGKTDSVSYCQSDLFVFLLDAGEKKKYKNKMMFHIWEGDGRRLAMEENNSASLDRTGRRLVTAVRGDRAE